MNGNVLYQTNDFIALKESSEGDLFSFNWNSLSLR